MRRIHHHPDAFSAAPAPRQIEPDVPNTAARVTGLVARSNARAATGSRREHDRRQAGLGTVDLAVGHVGRPSAQRGGRAVERLRGRAAEIGAGMQHAERELDAGVARLDTPSGAGDGVSSVERQTDRRHDRRQRRGRCCRPQRAWRGKRPSGRGGRGRRTMRRRRRRQGGHAAAKRARRGCERRT